nr:hypothetical protein [Micromonospora purpureochromogenes]
MTLAIAVYAAVISTVSLALAAVSYRVAGPVLNLSWEYDHTLQELVVFVANTGRSDVTVDSVDLLLERREVYRRGRFGIGHLEKEESILTRIPLMQWADTKADPPIPLRISSNSRVMWHVARDVLESMPWDEQLSELSLVFELDSPRGTERVWFQGELLTDFLLAAKPTRS